jgi:hypothetical protein
MNHMNVKHLIDRWTTDPEFRQAMRKDAEAALRREHVELTPSEWKILREVDWNLSDEELQSRVSKFFS